MFYARSTKKRWRSAPMQDGTTAVAGWGESPNPQENTLSVRVEALPTDQAQEIRLLLQEYSIILLSEKSLEERKEQIRNRMAILHDENAGPDGVMVCENPAYTVKWTRNPRRDLSREKLLDLGVRVQTIEAATSQTESETLSMLSPKAMEHAAGRKGQEAVGDSA